MKRFGTFLILTLLLLPLLAQAGENNPWERKLPFKSATIKYVLSGNETGTETLYIRKGGKEMATYHTAINTMGEKSNKVNIMTLDWLYSFDLLQKIGTKSVNPHKYMLEEYNKLSKADKERVAKNAKDMGLSMSRRLNGKMEKNAEKILGYDCDKLTVLGTSVYSIHNTGIPLKSDTSLLGVSMQKLAKEIKTGPVDDKFFQFPKGIVPKEDPQADAMAKSIAQKTIALLKEPEGSQKGQPASPKMAPGTSEGGTPAGVDNEKLEQAMKMLKKMQNK